jgi:hypothetical protein
MSKAKESTRQFFDNLVQEYTSNHNEYTEDKGIQIFQKLKLVSIQILNRAKKNRYF